MPSGNREDYLINILRLTEKSEGRAVKTTELASFMSISPASVTGMLKVLSEEGLLDYTKYRGFTLSDEGRVLASRLRKKHHVIEGFLMDTLDLDHDTAHTEAHHMEHAISFRTVVRICNLVGNPIDDDCRFCTNKCEAYHSAMSEDD